jgi:hypothetical protein
MERTERIERIERIRDKMRRSDKIGTEKQEIRVR